MNTSKIIKGVCVGCVAVGLIYVLFFSSFASYITEENIRSFVTGFGVYAPLVFGLIYFVVTLLLISAAFLSILSGILFGKFWGSVIVIVAATTAATAGFLIARFFGEDLAHKLTGGKGTLSKWVKKLDDYIDENGFTAFVVLRCLFLPYMPVSYAAGLIKKAKLRDFFFATLITNCIFSPLFVYLGDAIFKDPKALIIPIVLIILAFQVPKLVRKFKKEKVAHL